MRDRFPLLVVAGLAIAGVVGWLITNSAKRGSFAGHLSTYRSDRHGARALYLLSEQWGLGVSRSQKDFSQIEQADAQLVLLGVQSIGDFDEDIDRLLKGKGILPDGGVTNDDTDEDGLDDEGRDAQEGNVELSGDEVEKLLEHVVNGNTLVYAPWSRPSRTLSNALGVELIHTEAKLGLRTLVPSQPTRWTRGVERIETKVRHRLKLPDHAMPILEDAVDGSVIAAVIPHGTGQVFVLGAPALAMNESIGFADNAQFWRSTLSTIKGPIVFDEFHHGFTSERSIGAFAARYGLHFAAAQLLLGTIFWALSLKRFGRAKVPREAARFGTTDALSATSRIYREGRHIRHAAEAILRELSTVLAPRAGLSVRSTPSQIGEQLERRGHTAWSQAFIQIIRRTAVCTTEARLRELAEHAALLRQHVTTHERKAS